MWVNIDESVVFFICDYLVNKFLFCLRDFIVNDKNYYLLMKMYVKLGFKGVCWGIVCKS